MKNIFEENKDKLIDYIKSKKELLAIYLFGSFADSTYNLSSDIDLAVVYDSKYDIDKHVCDMIDIEKIFNNTKVDYINLDDISVFFRFSILKNGILLYTRDEEKLSNYIYKTQELYIDMKYSREKYKDYVLNNSSIDNKLEG